MKHQNLLVPMIGLTLVTLLTSGCGLLQAGPMLSPTPTPSAPPTVSTFRVTTDNAIQGQPDISGDYVVWADHRHGNIDVYAYNLATEEETRITTDEEEDVFPLLFGNLVVWARKGRLYGYRLGTEDAEEFSVASYDSLSMGCPATCGFIFRSGGLILSYGVRPHFALSERALVWSDEETEDVRDIVAFDLEQDTRIRITDDAASQEWPAAAGGIIMWADERDDGGDIYAYDLDAQEEFPIVTAPLTQTMPSTDGSVAVWIDQRDGNDDIYGYDLETQSEFPIVTGPANRSMPIVGGNFVVWMEEHNEDWDIHGYDLVVGEEFPIVTEDGWQGNPRIWDNVVVWTDRRDEKNQDIYGAVLEY